MNKCVYNFCLITECYVSFSLSDSVQPSLYLLVILIVKNNYYWLIIIYNNIINYTCIMKLIIIYFDLPLVTSVLHNHDNKQFLFLDLQLLVTSHQFPPTHMRFYIHYYNYVHVVIHNYTWLGTWKWLFALTESLFGQFLKEANEVIYLGRAISMVSFCKLSFHLFSLNLHVDRRVIIILYNYSRQYHCMIYYCFIIWYNKN